MGEKKAVRPKKRGRVKKIIGGFVKLILLLAILAAVGLYGAKAYIKNQAEKNKSTDNYSMARVMRGSMDSTVYGTGTTSARSQPTITAGVDGTLTELRVSIGDSVKKGEILAIIENDELEDNIRSDEFALWDLDEKISSTRADSTLHKITAPVAGRVMAIYAHIGDDSLSVFRKYGALAIISTDGRMKAELDGENAALDVALGETLKVYSPRIDTQGVVTDLTMQGTHAVVTINTDEVPMNEEVTIAKANGTVLGTATLQINKPMEVSSYGGTINSIGCEVGKKVSRTSTLFTIVDAPLALNIEDLLIQRDAAAKTLKEDKEKRESLIVVAPCDGVVATLDVAEGDSVENGKTIGSILEGEDMNLTIAVDELDVVNVAIGQKVTITIDALSGAEMSGEVYKIAPVGSSSSGVTTYDVELSFDATGSGVRSGMNATGEIQVAHSDDALYVPVEAIRTINNQTYVMVADGGVSASAIPSSASGSRSGNRQRSSNGSGSGMPDMSGMPGGAPSGMGGGMPSGGMPDMGSMPDMSNLPEGFAGMPGAADADENAKADKTEAEETEQKLSPKELYEKAVAFVKAWLYEGVDTQQQNVTGSLVRVEVGMQNDDYAQIVSGASEGDVVLYTASSSSSSNSFGGMGGGMRMMGF